MIISKLKVAICVAIISILVAVFSIYSFTHNPFVLALMRRINGSVFSLGHEPPTTQQNSQKPQGIHSKPEKTPGEDNQAASSASKSKTKKGKGKK